MGSAELQVELVYALIFLGLFAVIFVLLTVVTSVFSVKLQKRHRIKLLEQDVSGFKPAPIAKGGRRRVQEMIDHMPYPVWVRDHDLKIIRCNEVYAHIIGKPAVQVIEEQLELSGHSHQIAKRAQVTGDPQHERRHIIDSGKRALFEIIETPITEGIVGTAINMQQLELAQDELEQHTKTQADLLESSRSAIAIFAEDKTIKYYNQAYCHLWQLDDAFLMSNPAYSDILDRLREDRKLPEQANFQAFKKEQLELFKNVIRKTEDFYYLPDGTVLHVLMIPHDNGGLLFSYEDMTDQINLERSYNTLMSVKKLTLDNLTEAIAVFGEDGRVQLTNPQYQDMWNQSADFLEEEPHISAVIDQKRGLFDMDDEEWKVFTAEMMRRLGSRAGSKTELVLKDGRVIDATFVALPDGATLMVFSDQTDRYQLEHSLRAEKEAIEEADSIKTKFLANVSYELRSPLTSIRGFSEALLMEYFGEVNEKQKEYLDNIMLSSKRLSQLIDNILDVASIDAGYMTLNVEEFDVEACLKDTLQRTTENMQIDGVDVSVKVAKNVGKLLADKKRIQQIVAQLLRNAIRMCGDDGEVVVSAKRGKAGYINISVSDTGIGIPEDEQQYVFEKFFKIRKDGYSGTGLGLTIAKSFVELHGGTISLDSTPNEGTTISIQLMRRNPDLVNLSDPSSQPETPLTPASLIEDVSSH